MSKSEILDRVVEERNQLTRTSPRALGVALCSLLMSNPSEENISGRTEQKYHSFYEARMCF